MRLRKTISPLFTVARVHTYAFSTAYLNRKINEYVRSGNVNDAHNLFDEFPHSRNVVSWNTLINAYVKTRHFGQAQKLFDEMPHRDVVSWNTLISGYRDAQNPEKVHHYFLRMMGNGARPDELTFAVIMSAVLNTEFDVLVRQLHGLVFRLGLDRDKYLESALMRGYIGLGDRDGFRRVFDEVTVKHVVVCNVLMLGYVEFGLIGEAKRAFDSMPRRNAYSWSIMIKGFMKNKMVSEAREVFDGLPEKDVVSWTSMITGCTQCEKFVEALDIFVEMMSSGTCSPNGYTFSSVLHACSGCSSLATGNQLHACLLKFGIPFDVVHGSSLVDMYAKCGDIAAAFCVFESMTTKNLVSWNSIVGGYARHGLADRALEEFQRMVLCDFLPDRISFINVLSACVHGGKVKEAEAIFDSMEVEFGVQAEMEHYSCMVDLYGKAGQLEKAEEVIKTMPFEPDVVVWGALLGACGIHSCLELGEFAAMGMSKVEHDHPAVYTTLSKIYGENGARSGVFQLETMIEKWRARKQKARSWIQFTHGTNHVRQT